MSYKDTLIEAAKSYSSATGRALSGIGREILNDTRFFERIMSGGGCRIDTYEKVMSWFAANTPTQSNLKKPPTTKK